MKSRLGCLGAGLILVAALWIGWNFMTGYLPVRTFDSDTWKRAERAGDHSRLHMIEHLVWSGQLDGLTEAQVIELLGTPPETNYFREWDYVYRLGPERSFIGIDSEWLVIDFDRAGMVAKYDVVRD